MAPAAASVAPLAHWRQCRQSAAARSRVPRESLSAPRGTAWLPAIARQPRQTKRLRYSPPTRGIPRLSPHLPPRNFFPPRQPAEKRGNSRTMKRTSHRRNRLLPAGTPIAPTRTSGGKPREMCLRPATTPPVPRWTPSDTTSPRGNREVGRGDERRSGERGKCRPAINRGEEAYGEWSEEPLHRGRGGFQRGKIGDIFVTVTVGEEGNGGNVNRGKRAGEGERRVLEKGRRGMGRKRGGKRCVEMEIGIGDHRWKGRELDCMPCDGGSEAGLGGVDSISSGRSTCTASACGRTS